QRLVAWKKYRVLLSRINPEDAPNIVWPTAPES
ncbi:tail fiber assembly protein, partial [Salmonella enterica subsp. enterica serovar Typhimurium]|nr:tail fiber assembly protein [Salmonella enterica subsp. enterica serovar Typhimurium]